MNNKRNMKGFDPFMPVRFSEVGKSRANENIDITSSNFIDNSFNFVAASDNFKIDMPSVKKGLVVLLTKKAIGTENALGIKLMNDFVISLSDLVKLPQYVIMMNEAVYLLNNENVKDSIIKMQKYGVRFLVSKESLECFGILGNVKGIKQVTLADITEKITYSEHLINM